MTCFPGPFGGSSVRGTLLRGSMLGQGSTTRFFNAKNSPGKQALMPPHGQDMCRLRFRSTFSGAPLISFRQPRPYGEGHHRSRASGVSGTGWQNRHLLPRSLRPGCPGGSAAQGAGYNLAPQGSLILWVSYSGKFQHCFDCSYNCLVWPSCFRCAWHLVIIAGSFRSKVLPKLVSPLQPSQHVEPSLSPACLGVLIVNAVPIKEQENHLSDHMLFLMHQHRQAWAIHTFNRRSVSHLSLLGSQ